MSLDLVIRGAYLRREDAVMDIGIMAGRIVEISQHIRGAAKQEIAAEGRFVSPALVDPHLHMDKALTCTGQRFPKYNDYRDADFRAVVRKRIDAGIEYYQSATAEEVKRHTLQHAAMCIRSGTLFARTFVDVDRVARLKAMEGVLAARESLKGLIDLQVVAFGQSGFLADHETEPYVRKALEMGADLIGGLDPATIEGDIERGLDTVFRIAEEHNVDIDNHIMDYGTLGIYTLERQAEKAVEHGYAGRVTSSHSFALGNAPEAWIDRAIPKFKNADMRFVTCYKSSPYRMPVKKLLEAGVTVAVASDNVRDFWRAYGNADPVQAALIEMHRLEMNTNSDLDLLWEMITTQAAKVMGIDRDYGIEVGKKADLVVLDAPSPHWAIIDQAKRLFVVKNGRVVAKDGELLAEAVEACGSTTATVEQRH